jgi:hypothetical protein
MLECSVIEQELGVLQKVALVAFLLFIDLDIYVFDQLTGAGVSIRPLFVVPVVLAGMFLDWWLALIVAGGTAYTQVLSYRMADFSNSSFSYWPNIGIAFFAYIVVVVVVISGSEYRKAFYRKMYEKNLESEREN